VQRKQYTASSSCERVSSDFVFNGLSFNLEPETFDSIKFRTVGGRKTILIFCGIRSFFEWCQPAPSMTRVRFSGAYSFDNFSRNRVVISVLAWGKIRLKFSLDQSINQSINHGFLEWPKYLKHC